MGRKWSGPSTNKCCKFLEGGLDLKLQYQSQAWHTGPAKLPANKKHKSDFYSMNFGTLILVRYVAWGGWREGGRIASSHSNHRILPKIRSQNSWNRNQTYVFYQLEAWLVRCALPIKRTVFRCHECIVGAQRTCSKELSWSCDH